MSRISFDVKTFLSQIERQQGYKKQIVHVETIPERKPVYGNILQKLSPAMRQVLQDQGIEKLYSHQATAISHIQKGESIVIVTATASGKTLCYNIPVIETLIDNPSATALYLFPTKALAQDQLRTVDKFKTKDGAIHFLAGTYDGDTPQTQRRKIKDGGSIILTNPDMLHQGILPQHARWNRFFSNLQYIVIDEVHAYRGVFGSHLANVMRRLSRICSHYGADPQFICCSATIANPKEHAERITGKPMMLVDNDGSPRGKKQFVLWNPPSLEMDEVKPANNASSNEWRVGGERRSPVVESANLMTALVQEGVQTIAFVRTRLAAELLFKTCRDRLRRYSRRLADSVHAYRGGYLPEERREIEQRLVRKEILGIASTNALELGIDIGSLDVCIMVGFPGAIASMWQQAGRAGRGNTSSLVILIADNSPIDQYLMMHCDYLFGKNPEQAVVDPDNPHIAVGHIKCAAHELPLRVDELELFGEYTPLLLELLEDDKILKKLRERWYWTQSDYPASDVSLRNIAGPVYTIQDESRGSQIIGTLDEVSAFSQLHTHAVYLHGADTYLVNDLDVDQKIAYVERRNLDYYTQSVQVSQIGIDQREEENTWRKADLGFGDVTVTTTIPMFKKIKFHSRDSLGFEKLELPSQTLETVAFWFCPPDDVVKKMQAQQMLVGEALIGLANVLVEVAPIYVMCDTQDIGAVTDASCLGRDALFIHDRYPGGMGYARRCLDNIEGLFQTAASVIRECRCEDGCPSCVGSAVPAFALTDLDSAVRGRIPMKTTARFLLKEMGF